MQTKYKIGFLIILILFMISSVNAYCFDSSYTDSDLRLTAVSKICAEPFNLNYQKEGSNFYYDSKIDVSCANDGVLYINSLASDCSKNGCLGQIYYPDSYSLKSSDTNLKFACFNKVENSFGDFVWSSVGFEYEILIYNEPVYSSVSCIDSDGGYNLFVKGSIRKEFPKEEDGSQRSSTYRDLCHTGTINPNFWTGTPSFCEGSNCFIKEFACDIYDQVKSYDFTECEFGCKNGACVSECGDLICGDNENQFTCFEDCFIVNPDQDLDGGLDLNLTDPIIEDPILSCSDLDGWIDLLICKVKMFWKYFLQSLNFASFVPESTMVSNVGGGSN